MRKQWSSPNGGGPRDAAMPSVWASNGTMSFLRLVVLLLLWLSFS